jgi:hypothetical protein
MDIRHLTECMVALDMGIIPFDMDLKEAFDSLGKEDAKIAKRKYRKLKKKALNFSNQRRSEKWQLKYSEVRGQKMKQLVARFFSEEVKKRINEKASS